MDPSKSARESRSTFKIDVLYSQIAVFQAGIENPFSLWTKAHEQQGFAWREGTVSFKTIAESGRTAILVRTPNDLRLRTDTIRAIEVPFTVPESELVEIGSITESRIVEMDPGHYQLVYENGTDEQGQMWCEFTFLKTKRPTARVVIADDDLKVPDSLILSAEPA